MESLRLRSAVEQVAEHLREEVLSGGMEGEIPGVKWLAAELGINHKTVETALSLLEKEGLLVGQGAGRRRRIELPQGSGVRQRLRVGILVPETSARRVDYILEIEQGLTERGNRVFYHDRTMAELGMDVGRIAQTVKEVEADAWVVLAGSRGVIEWFSQQEIPAFALFGRRRGLPIASTGPDKPPALAQATRRLIELGHSRIVMLCRKVRRLPGPGAGERAFLEELRTHGITPGPYNLPDWEETTDGFHRCLESLFHVTPPTALIVDEPPFFFSVLQFCGRRKIRIPEDLSLMCQDPDPAFAWFQPKVTHIAWDSRPWVRRIVRWVDNVSRGKNDRRQSFNKAEFVEGGMIGPVSGKPAITGA